MTRIFLEIDGFLVKMWKKLWKWSKLNKKVKIHAIKYNLLDFYLLKFWIKIFKISTIVESLVTLPEMMRRVGQGRRSSGILHFTLSWSPFLLLSFLSDQGGRGGSLDLKRGLFLVFPVSDWTVRLTDGDQGLKLKKKLIMKYNY